MAEVFGRTPWGRAWIDALEHRAGLDPNRLPRGRTYARQDRVSRLETGAGRITALVRGGRVLPYRVAVGVRPFDDATWALVTGAIAARAGHAAALLDGELDPGIVTDTREVGVELFPGPGDLQLRCSCPDHAEPCKHAAAVCYLVARLLDEDPFRLFELRGRDRDRLLGEVRSHRQRAADPRSAAIESADAFRDAGDTGTLVDPGVPARAAWARWLDRSNDLVNGADAGPEPTSPSLRDPLPDRPGAPAEWPADPPPDAPFTAEGLQRLAADAAQRAWAQLADGAPSGLLLDAEADLARRAARREAGGQPLADLARAAGLTPTALATMAAIWRQAGEEGLRAAAEPLWRPPENAVAAARQAFEDAGVDPRSIQVRSNRVTVGDVQLRVTADGRWWRYEKRERAWELVEAPSGDPTDLVGGPA